MARFPDSVSLEVRIVDRIINFRSALVNVLVFCWLTFHFRGFRKRLSRYPTHAVYMYSSIDSVTEMTSGNLVHGSCMVTHGSGNGSNVPWGRGGTLGISGWGCAAGTLEPLTYTRASSAEFCYPILE